MPDFEALLVRPVSEEPNLVGAIERAQDFEPDKALRSVNQMRARPESLLDFFRHPARDREFA
jgi:hypothetical protein